MKENTQPYTTGDFYRHFVHRALEKRNARPPDNLDVVIAILQTQHYDECIKSSTRFLKKKKVFDIHNFLKITSLHEEIVNIGNANGKAFSTHDSMRIMLRLSELFNAAAHKSRWIKQQVIDQKPHCDTQAKLFICFCEQLQNTASRLNDQILLLPPNDFKRFCNRMIDWDVAPLCADTASKISLDALAEKAVKAGNHISTRQKKLKLKRKKNMWPFT